MAGGELMAGELITAAWQVELQGVLMGSGTDVVVKAFDPWAAPAIRSSDAPRAGANGITAGDDLLGGRNVAVQLAVRGEAVDDMAVRRTLSAAFMRSAVDVPIVWMEDDGVKYRMIGRPRLAAAKVEPRIPTEGRFVATDPRIYADTETTIATGVVASSGGLTFSASAPFVFGTGGTGSTIAAVNAGLVETPWIATFTGPLTAPSLEHVEQARILTLSGGALLAGETLVIDSATRTVLLNGTTSRYSWLASTSQWFTLEPGVNSLRLGAASGSGTVQVRFRSAWI